jgi:hypothetical protein
LPDQRTEGSVTTLDYGQVVITAWWQDPDEWDWRLTAVPPDTTWPFIAALDE